MKPVLSLSDSDARPVYSLEHMLSLQVWRHSTLANFYLHRIASDDPTATSRPQTYPILEPSSPPLTSLALFSPTQHHLAYVHANDLYILPANRINMEPKKREKGWEGEAIRITKDGSQTVMSGRPSWVYEEEVGCFNRATVWSAISAAPESWQALSDADLVLFARRSFPPTRPSGGPPRRHTSPSSRLMNPKSLCTSTRSTTRVRLKRLRMPLSMDGNIQPRWACGIPRYASAIRVLWLFLDDGSLSVFAERLYPACCSSYSLAIRTRAPRSASSPSLATSLCPPTSQPKNASPPRS